MPRQMNDDTNHENPTYPINRVSLGVSLSNAVLCSIVENDGGLDGDELRTFLQSQGWDDGLLQLAALVWLGYLRAETAPDGHVRYQGTHEDVARADADWRDDDGFDGAGMLSAAVDAIVADLIERGLISRLPN
jgi:hypothetical protein